MSEPKKVNTDQNERLLIISKKKSHTQATQSSDAALLMTKMCKSMEWRVLQEESKIFRQKFKLFPS